MGIWSEIKYALNSTLGTGYKESLDVLLGAKIICRGYIGTKFTITNIGGYYPEKTAEITENSKKISGELRFVLVPVPLGSYTIDVQIGDMHIEVPQFSVSSYGGMIGFSYSAEIANFTSDDTFVVPKNVYKIFIDAAGGGGGGGGSYGTHGGGGGGGADFVKKAAYEVTPGEKINIQIGIGGARGEPQSNGSDGTATIIENLVTLAGGKGGFFSSSNSAAGGSGKTSGGYGGNRNSSVSGSYGTGGSGGQQGKNGSAGVDGSSAGGGGGGGGSYGIGGDGGAANNTTSSGFAGYLGGGGGGGGGTSNNYISYGGKGGDGFVIISTGV